MISVLEACCLVILISSVTALPAVPVVPGPWDPPGATSLSLPILQGPWNSPETSSPFVPQSSSLAQASSSVPLTTISISSNSSHSLSKASSSSSLFVSQRSSYTSTILSTEESRTESRNSKTSTSAISTTVRSSASSAGSASNTISVTGVQSTKLLTTSNTIFSQSQTPKSFSSTSRSQKPSFAFTSSQPPTSTVTGGQTRVASTSTSQPPSPNRNTKTTSSTSSVSSITSSSTKTSAVISLSKNSSSILAAESSISSGAVISSTLVPAISITNTSAISAISAFSNACGPVAEYYNPTPKNWTDHNTDVWLNTWVNNNVGPIAANTYGFTGAFATWAIGNPDFNCRDDGSSGNCDFNPCDNVVLNAKGNDVAETYYIMESLVGIHTYFTGLREAFTVSAIGAALSKDGWAQTFYNDKDDKSVIALREILNVLAMTVGMICALSGLGGLIIGTVAAVSATLYAGAVGAFNPTIGMHVDNTFQTSADLGRVLGDIVVETIQSFTSANNILMHGQNYLGTGDLRDYWRGGAFVDYPGVDKNAAVNTMNAFLIGQAINQLYRKQKIFIMGGGACGDNQGIGQGPQGYSVCRDGKAWYIYWWQENNVLSVTLHQWGWVSPPPGSDQLGKGDYAAVTVQDIINSSLDAYIVAGYNYNNVTAFQRAQSAIANQWANPAAQGPAWEGVFTIPVCNISQAINSDYYDKDWILQDYGHDSRPVWCGPICDGDAQKTKDFISAANMENFQSPTHVCEDQDSEATWWMGV